MGGFSPYSAEEEGATKEQCYTQARFPAEDTTDGLSHFSIGSFSHNLKSLLNSILTLAFHSPLLCEN